MTQTFKTLIDVAKVFSNEETCREHLAEMRWAGKPECPFCDHKKVYVFKDKKTYKCAKCRKRFSVRVGTIFEDSKIELQKWFMAIYLITSHKKGISSIQLAKDIGVEQRTAWFILHRLRHASKTKAFSVPLKNEVETDETYIGGKNRNRHNSKKVKNIQGRSTKDKTAVLGLVERKGIVKAEVLENVTGKEIRKKVTDNVVEGSKLYSDEFRSYRPLKWLFSHEFVNHSAKQYAKGDAHTNTIEGFWSLLKRGIVGIYHFVSPKHLDNYLNEFTFRYNTKDQTEEERFNFLLENCQGRLRYNQLISKA